MKASAIFLFLFKVQSLIAQGGSDSVVIKTAYTFDVVAHKKEEIKAFADSINNYSGLSPTFLLDECFEINKGHLRDGFHSSISLRLAVLEQVNNSQALRQILRSRDPRLRTKCHRYGKRYKSYPGNIYLHIPFRKKSFRTLIRNRYKKLN